MIVTRRSTLLAALATVMLASAPASAAPGAIVSSPSAREDLAVTVYNENLGLVKDTRRIGLRAGNVPVRFDDVASQIDGTSVSFRSLSDARGVQVLEQNYEYDLITPAKLMEKYVGKDVTIRIPPDTDRGVAQVVHATLLSTNEGYVYRIGNAIYLQPPGQVILPDLPADLVAQPSLVWLLDVKRGGPQRIEASYMTSGMGWEADYVVVSDRQNVRASLNGWVTLKNNSGVTYPDARLTLVAGDVHRASQPAPRVFAAPMAAEKARGSSQFSEQALFEYHSYDLKRRATLKNNQTKQISLLNASGVGTRKIFAFDGSRSYGYGNAQQKVQVMLEIANTQANGLGMPLPKGRVRVYQEDRQGKLQFIGEDRIDHTPRDEKVRVEMGNAFDIIGSRRMMSEQRLSDHVYEATYQVDLRNHKDRAVTVDVLEHQYGDWQVIAKSHPYNKISANDLDFPVQVPANGATKVTYTVRIIT